MLSFGEGGSIPFIEFLNQKVALSYLMLLPLTLILLSTLMPNFSSAVLAVLAQMPTVQTKT